MAERLQANVSILCERTAKEGKVVELLVREQRENSYVGTSTSFHLSLSLLLYTFLLFLLRSPLSYFMM